MFRTIATFEPPQNKYKRTKPPIDQHYIGLQVDQFLDHVTNDDNPDIGSLTMRIDDLKIPKAYSHLVKSGFVFKLKWHLYDYTEDMVFPQPHRKLQCTCKCTHETEYVLNLNHTFETRIARDPLQFALFAVREDFEYFLGRTYHFFKNVHKHNKLWRKQNIALTNNYSKTVVWLKFRYQFKCNQHYLNSACRTYSSDGNIASIKLLCAPTFQNQRRDTNRTEKRSFNLELEIHIESVCFLARTSLYNSKAQKILIEYSFLDYEDDDVETPFCFLLPEPHIVSPIVFTKIFPIGLENEFVNCRLLGHMLKTKKHIHFFIVAQRQKRKGPPVKKRVGVAILKLNELLRLDNKDEMTIAVDILDSYNLVQVIGHMAIRIAGIIAMKMIASIKFNPDMKPMFVTSF